VDLAGLVGSPIVASVGGTVTFAGTVAGRGVVVISFRDSRTTYEPVVAEVTVDQTVQAGERIGTLDITQSHCLPAACLHWGWIRDGEYLDPRGLIGQAGRVRLLPLTPADGPGDRPS
jgi:murein DD-endopeptidase MepM/ murein hydrolase activator NlpD